MYDLHAVNELHHSCDYKRLYNIALAAVRANKGVPYSEMQSILHDEVIKQNLNASLYEEFSQDYIMVLEIAHTILKSIHEASPIPNSFSF